MAVIAAGELDDDVAAGEAAGQANGAHRRLGAGLTPCEPSRWTAPPATISSASSRFQLGRRAEAGAVVQRFLDGLDDARMAVAEDQRPPGADVIEIAIAVEVEEIRALRRGR